MKIIRAHFRKFGTYRKEHNIKLLMISLPIDKH